MPTKLEKERKFLVKFPKSWSELSELFNDLVDVKRISQNYLKPDDSEEQAARVRKTIEGLSGDKNIIYHYNKKTPVEVGVHKEEEREITKAQFEKYLKDKDSQRNTVEKTRFVFKYNDQIFELDVFKGPLKGLAILEIELKDIDDTVELPPFLEVKKEVTKDKRFNNFSLSHKKFSK